MLLALRPKVSRTTATGTDATAEIETMMVMAVEEDANLPVTMTMTMTTRTTTRRNPRKSRKRKRRKRRKRRRKRRRRRARRRRNLNTILAMIRLAPVHPVPLPPYLLTPTFMAMALFPHLHRAAHPHHLPHRILMTPSLRKLPDTSRSSRRRRRARLRERVFQTDLEIFLHLYPSRILSDTGNWIFNGQLLEQRNRKVKRHANGCASAGQIPEPQIPHYTILASNFTG